MPWFTIPLINAIAEARRITSRGALGRQYQFIGKLMRDIDMDALEAALTSQESAQKTRARLRR
jgi:ribosome-associated protein